MRLYRIMVLLVLALSFQYSHMNAANSDKTKELKTIKFSLGENQRAIKPYTIRYNNRNFVVYPNVFSPKYFPDTFWFEKNLQIEPGESFLEIGSGTGLISVMAAVKGASSVTAIDINPNAVRNTTENVFLNHVASKFRIFEGDVFEPIPLGQKFDVIFWFAPFMDIDVDKSTLTELEKSVFDPNHASLKKYMSGARHFLSPNGRLFLGYSPTHGEMDVVEQLAEEYGWSLSIVASEEGQIPAYPLSEQVDFVTVALLELKPMQLPIEDEEAIEEPVEEEPLAQQTSSPSEYPTYEPSGFYQPPVVYQERQSIRSKRKVRCTRGLY